MDVANIIINTKKKEFMSIIELYRENHDKGFEENDIESLGGSKEYYKKKKKTRRGTNNRMFIKAFKSKFSIYLCLIIWRFL